MRISFTRLSFILFMIILLYGAIWLIRAIWFRPDNIHIFFQRLPYEYAQTFPEDISRVNIPQASLIVPYNSFLNEESPKNPAEVNFWRNVREILEAYTSSKWEPIKQYHYENLQWMSRELAQSETTRSFFPPYALTTDFLLLMDRVHQIDSKEGAEAYVARLKRFDEKIRLYANAPNTPMDSLSYEAVRQKFTEWIELAPTLHPLYRAFARKAIAADPTLLNEGEAARLLQEVERVIIEEITPAFRAVISRLDESPITSPLPESSLYAPQYQKQLSFSCSFPLAPDSLHLACLQVLDSIPPLPEEIPFFREDSLSLSIKMDSLLTAGKYLAQISSGLFDLSSDAPLEIFPYSEVLANSIHGGSYRFILQDQRGKGQWLVPSTVFSSRSLAQLPAYASYFGRPGLHTLHAAMWEHASPTYLHRQFLHFPAFEQGWALYASQSLRRDLQVFSYQPLVASGFDQLLKTHLIRCIVDTGIHSQAWTYTEAFAFMEKHLTDTYPIQEELLTIYHKPGMACAAWVGYSKFLQIREAYQKQKGDRFILQDFHAQILTIGPGSFPAFEKVWNAVAK